MSQQFESVFNLYSLSVQPFMFQISSCFTISTENDKKKEAVSLSYWRLLWQVTRLTTSAHWRETTSYATCLGQSIRHSGVFSQTWPPCPSFLTSMELLVSSSTPATFLPHSINCCTAPPLLDFIQLILYEVALFAQSAKCVFEYYSAFTLGIWSMFLNARDLFFHLILLSITTSWCNASVNPCILTICLCICNNSVVQCILLGCL